MLDHRLAAAALRGGRRHDEEAVPPLERRPYGRWLLALRRRFGAGAVALMQEPPRGWTFGEWTRRTALVGRDDAVCCRARPSRLLRFG